MSTARADILLKISADLAGLKQTAIATQKARLEFGSLFNTIKGGFQLNLGAKFASMIAGIPGMLKQLTQQAVTMAGELKDTSERLNISAEALQVLGYSAKNAGADMGTLSRGLTEMDRSIGEARSGVGKTADAFRTLGLNAAELERVAPERRFEAIAKAVVGAKDQTAAFQAGSAILGNRTLPMLMGSLRDVAENGYDAYAKSVKDAGQVMDEFTMQRLDRAQKAIDRLKNRVVIATGEAAAAGEALAEAFTKDKWGGLKALFGGPGDMALFVAKNSTPVDTSKPKSTLASNDLSAINSLRLAELNLLNIRRTRAQVENDTSLTERQRKERQIELLKEERALLSEINQLKNRGYVTTGDNSPTAVGARELRPLAKGEPVTPEQLKLRSESDQRDTEIESITKRIDDLSGERGVGRFRQQMTLLRDDADSTFDLLNAGWEGMTNGISDALLSARSLGDGFKRIGQSIMATIAQVIARVIAMRIAMAVFSMFGFGGFAEGGLVGKAGGGTGTAVPVTAFSGSFASGGWTGPGGKFDPRGIVHAGEYVIPKDAVDRIGVPALDRVRQAKSLPGYADGGVVGRQPSTGRGGITVNQTINVTTGVQDTVRAEIYGMMPEFRAMAVDATADALARGQLQA